MGVNSRHRDIVKALGEDPVAVQDSLLQKKEWTISDIVVYGALDAGITDGFLDGEEGQKEINAAYVRAGEKVKSAEAIDKKIRKAKPQGGGHERKLIPRMTAKAIAESLFDPKIGDIGVESRRRSRKSYRHALNSFNDLRQSGHVGVDDEIVAFGPRSAASSLALDMDLLLYMFRVMIDELHAPSSTQDGKAEHFSTARLMSDLADLYLMVSENYHLSDQWLDNDPSAVEVDLRKRLEDPSSYFDVVEGNGGWDAFWHRMLPTSYDYATGGDDSTYVKVTQSDVGD